MLKPLGKVHAIVQTGHIIVKPLDADIVNELKLGYIVVDMVKKRIGKVSDVIGNVKNPFIVVKPENKDLARSVSIDELLYVDIPPPKRKARPPSRRSKARRGRGGGKGGGKRGGKRQ